MTLNRGEESSVRPSDDVPTSEVSSIRLASTHSIPSSCGGEFSISLTSDDVPTSGNVPTSGEVSSFGLASSSGGYEVADRLKSGLFPTTSKSDVCQWKPPYAIVSADPTSTPLGYEVADRLKSGLFPTTSKTDVCQWKPPYAIVSADPTSTPLGYESADRLKSGLFPTTSKTDVCQSKPPYAIVSADPTSTALASCSTEESIISDASKRFKYDSGTVGSYENTAHQSMAATSQVIRKPDIPQTSSSYDIESCFTSWLSLADESITLPETPGLLELKLHQEGPSILIRSTENIKNEVEALRFKKKLRKNLKVFIGIHEKLIIYRFVRCDSITLAESVANRVLENIISKCGVKPAFM